MKYTHETYDYNFFMSTSHSLHEPYDEKDVFNESLFIPTPTSITDLIIFSFFFP